MTLRQYLDQLREAVINIDYDTVVNLITTYPDNAKVYLSEFISDIYQYRPKSFYKEKGHTVIKMCNFLYGQIPADHFDEINYILLRWAIDTCNLDIVKCVVSLHKKFNIDVYIDELLTDCDNEFIDISDEILHYLVKNHQEFGIMDISNYYGYWHITSKKRFTNIGCEPIKSILI